MAKDAKYFGMLGRSGVKLLMLLTQTLFWVSNLPMTKMYP